jgi:hypothetical protein
MLGDFASLERRRLARVWSSLLKVKTAASGTPGESRRQRREGWKEGGKVTGFGCPGYFLFAVAEKEEFESWRDIVSDVVVVCFVDCEGGDGGAHEVVVIRCHLEFGCGSAVK